MMFQRHDEDVDGDAERDEEFKDDVADDAVHAVLEFEPGDVAAAAPATALTVPVYQFLFVIHCNRWGNCGSVIKRSYSTKSSQ